MRPPASATFRREDRSFVVATRFRGYIVRCEVPRDHVARLLPAGMTLGRPRDAARGTHPLVFVFGDHDRSAVLFASLSLPTGVRFDEMVIAVPWVRTADDDGPAMYLP